MAVNTRAKRQSVLGLPTPGGGINQSDRQTVAGIYGGILAAEAVAAALVQITSLAVAEYIAITSSATEYIAQSMGAGDYIAQTLTVEDSV